MLSRAPHQSCFQSRLGGRPRVAQVDLQFQNVMSKYTVSKLCDMPEQRLTIAGDLCQQDLVAAFVMQIWCWHFMWNTFNLQHSQ